MLTLLIGTWAAMIFGAAIVLWQIHQVDRKVETIWHGLMRRADVRAIEDGWVRDIDETKRVLPTADLPIGFVAPAAVAPVAVAEKGHDA